MSNASETYKRGQVVWALWQWIVQHGDLDPRRAEVPRSFATRVRKMSEFGVPLSDPEKPGKPGTDIEYTAYHAFEIAVAIILQDIGLKQAEVGFFVRSIRNQLRTIHFEVMANPPVPGSYIAAEDRPNCPTMLWVEGEDPAGLGDPRRKKLSDPHVYLTFRYVEIQEAWLQMDFSTSDWSGSAPHPMFLDPRFHRGIKSLMREMEYISRTGRDPARIVIELGNVAVLVTNYLRQAPPIRRGRR